MLEISIPFIIASGMALIVSIFMVLIIGISPVFEDNFFSENLEIPWAFISFSVSILSAIIGLSISFKFLIPVFIAMLAIGYIISIKFIPSWVRTLNQNNIDIILQSVTFPYYSTIILSVFWPLIILVKLLNKVLKPIFSIIQFKIETPNSALQREFKSLGE